MAGVCQLQEDLHDCCCQGAAPFWFRMSPSLFCQKKDKHLENIYLACNPTLPIMNNLSLQFELVML